MRKSIRSRPPCSSSTAERCRASAGRLAAAGSPAHAKKQNAVAHIKAIAERRRGRKRMPVIMFSMAVSPVAAMPRQNAPLFRIWSVGQQPRRLLGRRSLCGAEPKAGDFVIYKQRVSGFQGTDLENKLKGLGVSRLVVTGAWDQFRGRGHLPDGADLGYEITLVSDATWHDERRMERLGQLRDHNCSARWPPRRRC